MAMTPLPTLDRTASTFKTDVDTFFATQLPAFAAEANALETNVNAKEVTAAAAAVTATTQAGIATTQAGNATAQVVLAAASAASALNAPGTNATSTTSLSISTGDKTLTIQTGKAYSVGQGVVIANTTAPSNYMSGQIIAHDPLTGSLTVNALAIGGSGTYAAWTISMAAISATSAPPGKFYYLGSM